MIWTLSQVALGGAIGSMLRHLANIGAARLFGHGFPFGILLINAFGSFLMGVMVVVLAKFGGTRHAPFLMSGILGGFTTFSAFSLDAATLWERGQAGLALGYVAATVCLSLGGIAAGLFLARQVL
ncbi:fluoride efflux transporter CrcB [Szabonella alba]|uniref:Fluoride-specific ion channel FluC n=1 Tax=Szabonella alba TaxID=2804194 RepID=A0A8K0Y0M3_9RHOB|nr:fluoride efflux transporter CrcB [Szabonella alba]MBL4918360.1 fluoride efflux transporter CrcB [Szabonella alba]